MIINFITIQTRDLEQSVDFYRRVLDMQVSRRFSPRPGMEIAFMDGSGLQVEFIHDDKTPPFSGSGISLGFYVDNMEKTAAHLKEQQVEILSGPTTMKNGVKMLQARDCHGVELGFVQQL